MKHGTSTGKTRLAAGRYARTGSLQILAVPNDDGYGPSALLSYLVKAILSECPGCRVVVWNDFAFEFNRQLYAREISQGKVEISRVWNLVQFARPSGDLSLEGTLQLMSDYRQASARYGAGATGYDLVLDFGVPAAARWAARQGMPSISVFDHSWSKTFQMILADQLKFGTVPTRIARKWRRLSEEIEEDERHIGRLFVCPPIITPESFVAHWEKLIGAGAIRCIPGVLREPKAWSRMRAQAFLRITARGPAVLVQGGGTPVWNEPLDKLLEQVTDNRQRRALAQSGLSLVMWLPGRFKDDARAKRLAGMERVRRLEPIAGGTIQSILPAIDYMIIRAGGGSVNDAVAYRKPFVCVRERGQSQIEAILRGCEHEGISWGVRMEQFRDDPLEMIVDQCARLRREKRRLVQRMRRIPSHAERQLAREILKSL
jgi:hypothetical protein